MIKSLKLTNVGPAPTLAMSGLGERLNLISGDNGLGKSFLLDVAWWSMTRKWPNEINPRLISGRKALPRDHEDAFIEFCFSGKSKDETYESRFDRLVVPGGAWTGRAGRPANPGLVLYAMADGSFAVWDPARNYWIRTNDMDVQERQPGYVFGPHEVWDGLRVDGKKICNGLIQDWTEWQLAQSSAFMRLKEVLWALSPSEHERLVPGELARVPDDVQKLPTLRMSYGQDVPIVQASSGMRRIVALAYLLVWAWEEHLEAISFQGRQSEGPTRQIVVLVDEIEAHLHPKWQRAIIPALLKAVDWITKGNVPRKDVEVQIVAATHSPLIMASVEPMFDPAKDAWFDLDVEQNQVILTRREFERHGSIESWVTSEAFDLKSGRAVEYEQLIEDAGRLLDQESPSVEALDAMNQKLVAALNPEDPYLITWRFIRGKRCGNRG